MRRARTATAPPDLGLRGPAHVRVTLLAASPLSAMCHPFPRVPRLPHDFSLRLDPTFGPLGDPAPFRHAAVLATILPEAKMRAVVFGSRIRIMTAAKRCCEGTRVSKLIQPQ